MMKYYYYFLILICCGSVSAAEFVFNGELIRSINSEETYDCGSYKVILKKEKFPLKYEMNVPQELKIKGFYGSRAIVRQEAILIPGNTIIPMPQNILELKSQYPSDRTYLPTKATCSGQKLIISYWSGGNCKDCETFVLFDVVNNIPQNPQRSDYSHVKTLSKARTEQSHSRRPPKAPSFY